MKKTIITIILFISYNLIYSQVLFYEDFENYTSFQDLINLHKINYVPDNSNWDSNYLFFIDGAIDIDINENGIIDDIENDIKNTEILFQENNKVVKFELNKVNSLFHSINKFDSNTIDNKIPLSSLSADEDGNGIYNYEKRWHGIETSEQLGVHGVMSGMNEELTPLNIIDKYYRNIMNRNEVNTHTGQKRGFLPQEEYWFTWKIKLDSSYQIDQIDEVDGFLNGDTVYDQLLNANVTYASHTIDPNNNPNNKKYNSEVLGQWHVNTDAVPYSDPIHINIINGSWWLDINKYCNLEVDESSNSTQACRELVELFPVTKNEWINFTFRIKLSGSNDGYIKIWKNRRFDNNGQIVSDFHTIINGANHINNINPVYFKYGIYKADWWNHGDKIGTSTTKKVVYYDDVYAGVLDPLKNDFEIATGLIDPDCGKTLSFPNDMTISTYSINGVGDSSYNYYYKFRFRNIDDEDNLFWVDSVESTIDLTDNPNIKPNATYNVLVRVVNHPFLSNYSQSACQISTTNIAPGLTDPDCGKTLSFPNDMTISTYSINGVGDSSNNYYYKFRFRNIDDEDNLFWVDSVESTIDLTDNPNIKPNATYNVLVRVVNHPFLSNYSQSACQISTTNIATGLIDPDCGKTLSFPNNMTISTYSINGVGDSSNNYYYKFRFRNIDDEDNLFWVDSVESTIDLTDNPNIKPNATYNVLVRVVNHPFLSNYSQSACQIYTSIFHLTSSSKMLLESNKTNSVINNFIVYPNPVNKKTVLHIKGFNTIDFSRLKITMTDIYGLHHKMDQLTSSVDDFKLNLYNLKSGIYFLNLEYDNHLETKKIIIE